MTAPFFGAGVAILGPFPPRPGGVSVQCDILAGCLESDGASVTRVNTDLPRWRQRGRAGRLLLPLAQVPAIARHLRATCDDWQVLHVHAASWWGFMPAAAGLLARRWGKRLVLSYHGGEAAAFLSRLGWLARPVLRRYDALLALTPTQARLFAQHGLPAQVLPNIVPIQNFIFRPRGPLSPNLLWLRQLEPRYRPADALAVFAQVRAIHPAATLTLAGGGSLMTELERQVETEQLAGVRFCGHLDAAAVAPTYDAADIFLNTSAIDNLPLTLIEAGASGLPVVSTGAGAIPDLIRQEENGLLAAVGDVEGLSGHILRLLADPALAQRLSLAGRANAERFTWEQVGQSLCEVYGVG
jgi:phenylacetate-CoA ligase